MRRRTRLDLLGALAVISFGLANACGSEASLPEQAEEQAAVVETGTLQFPLETSVGGHIYRLVVAYRLVGPYSDDWYSTTVDDPAVVFEQTLQTGDYQLYFQSWQLYRLEGGVPQAVDATLTSPSPFYFVVQKGATSTMHMSFEVEDVTVPFVGTGKFSVDVSVYEKPPACSFLGNDCPAGFWCPPTDLTGKIAECVAVTGTKQSGEPCSGPSECQTNSACINLGLAPVCVELCPPSAFDQPCNGGVCISQGTQYGVCDLNFVSGP